MTPSSAVRGPLRPAAALLSCLLAVLALAGPAAAQDDGYSVTAVDATSEAEGGSAAVDLFLFGLDTVPGRDAVTLAEAGETIEVTSVTAASADGHDAEVVYVVDTNARAGRGSVLEEVKKELRNSVADLPAGTSVGIVSAGDTALVLQRPTTSRDRVATAIDELTTKNASSLLDGFDRAAALFGDDPGVIRSLVVLSTGPDVGSVHGVNDAKADLIQRGVQVVSIHYGSGEARLDTVATETGGAVLTASSEAEVGPAVEQATELAADRVVVSFRGVTEVGRRGNLTLTVDGVDTELSYPAGALINNVLQLAPQPTPDPPGLALFRSSIGLYIALALAFLGISLAVWSLGSIMAGGESSLEGMLSRYTDNEMADSDLEVEELIVQSALLQRAVDLSESFAEKRGFLARVEEMLERANLPVRAGEAMFMLIAILMLSAGLAAVLTKSLLAGLLFALFAGGVAFFVVRLLARRRFRAFESLLPDTLQLLSGTLRAGYSLPQGLEVVSKEISDPMGQELRRAMTEARLGRDLEECLGGVSERMASPDFAWAVMAISIQREVGGNLNELLMSVADTMIARERLKREIGALTAEGKMSAGVLSFLPPGLGLVMWIMNPEYINLLFTETMGNILLGAGAVSAFIGLAWMKKVITVDV